MSEVQTVVVSLSQLDRLLAATVNKCVEEAMAKYEGLRAADKYMNAQQAAEYLDLDKGTIYKWIREGKRFGARVYKLPCWQVGDDIRIKKADLIAFGQMKLERAKAKSRRNSEI